MDLIILSGLPASGKSTVAKALQGAFPYPILEKDRIKECLFDTLGFQSHAEKRRLDAAAAQILLQTAEDILNAGNSLILDNNFDTAAGEALRSLQERCRPRSVTVLLTADEDTLYERYLARDQAHTRHPGHALSDRYPPPNDIWTGAWARSTGRVRYSRWTPRTLSPWTETPSSPRCVLPWKPRPEG